ncbi:hypothetical protein EDD29_1700 [Actinocorallia herbida]|uniref:Uncharacterized protein n=1 Tax=Actinocorallia herbida TaxID=58109 RepID=A0A3N1CS87_9ACTN|nr:hypothetical protein [Actinocorallia herbida]ROO84182.1 hypothetical protein EDD29_1700 [Actinocorallia herbida]
MPPRSANPRILSFDGSLCLGAFGPRTEGHRSGIYRPAAAADGVLHQGFRRYRFSARGRA